MKEKLFVIGDLHGEYDLLEKMLKIWDKESQQLLFLGDLADRGPKVKQCIDKVMDLVAHEGAICITGNHEDIFLKWLEDPEERMDWYLRNGGQATLESLFYPGVLEEEGPSATAAQVKSRYSHIIDFYQGLPLYHETDNFIFVHAGLNLELEDWHQTSRRDCIWIRSEFHEAKNTTGKWIVFGHTPVSYLHDNNFDSNIWYQDKKLGIDGGAVYEGALHGLVIGSNGVEADYQIYHPAKRWE